MVKKTLEPRPQREPEGEGTVDAEGNGVVAPDTDESADPDLNEIVEDTARFSVDTIGSAVDSAEMDD